MFDDKPQGATHYAEYDGKIIYFMNTKNMDLGCLKAT